MSKHACGTRPWVSVIRGCFDGAANPAMSHTSLRLRGPLWPALQWDSTSEVLSVLMKTALGRNDVFGELFVECMAELIRLDPLTTKFLYTVDFPHWKHQCRTRTNSHQDRTGRFHYSFFVTCYTVLHWAKRAGLEGFLGGCLLTCTWWIATDAHAKLAVATWRGKKKNPI